jgi:hypothetical protein
MRHTKINSAGTIVDSAGNGAFVVTISDGNSGKSTNPDTIALQVSGTFTTAGAYSRNIGTMNLNGGNIVVHNS